MKSTLHFLAAVALSGLISSTAVAAPVMVTVGDAGNAADTGGTVGAGAVSSAYQIGKDEVTNTEYVQFLNAVAATDTYALYNTSMTSDSAYGGINRTGSSGSYTYATKAGYENKAVNFVSFWDAARYTNWLSNGATNGAATETGVYMLTAGGISGNTITRDTTAWNAGGYAIASRDEWYKAALYKGGSTNAEYWTYATQSDIAPTATATPNGDANQANYFVASGSASDLTPVGSFTGSASAYGTYDQNGSLMEWNDTISFTSTRGQRGGSFVSNLFYLDAFNDGSLDPANEYVSLGFRVSSLAAVPEPSEYGLMGAGAMAVAIWARRRRRTL